MYNGEVSVSQDSLNNFLSAAEELAVKGLTANDASATNLNAAASVSHFDEEQTHVSGNHHSWQLVLID